MTKEQADKVDALVTAGQLLSNFVWNIGVNNVRENNPDSVTLAYNLSRSWDAAKKVALPSLAAMREIPAAFDPISLGA